MSETPGNLSSSKRPALPWLLLAGFALVLAVGLDKFMERSMGYYTFKGAPEGFLLVHNLRKFPYLFVVIFALMAWLSRKWPRFSGSMILAWAAMGMTTVHLALCYLVMTVGVSLAGGTVPRRLPPELRATLELCDRLEMFVLLPDDPLALKSSAQAAGELRGYPVLGRVAVTNTTEMREVVTAFFKSVDESHGTREPCFRPRHGLRAGRGTNEVELLISYECRFSAVFQGDNVRELGVSDGSKARFDQLLAKAGTPLIPEANGVVAANPTSAK